MASKTPRNAFYIGARGSGKSYACRSLSRYRQRFVLIDPTSTVRSLTFTDVDPEAIAARMRSDESYSACLWAAHMTAEEMERALGVIIKEAERTDGFVTIAIDEFGVVAPSRKSIAKLERSARMGRHHEVSYWLLSQRLVDAHPNVLAVMDSLLIFRLASPTDYDYARRMLGGRELEAGIRGLGEFEYVSYDTGTGQWQAREPVK